MRLFVAVNVTAETKNKIFRIQSVLNKICGDLRWTPQGNLHLTLKFLGEVDDRGKNLVSEKLSQAVAGIKKFEIDFGKIGVFPSETMPRVLWLGVEKGNPGLENLAQKIESLLTEVACLGLEKEKKPFSAHLTVARFKNPRNKEKLFDFVKKMTIEKIPDAVETVCLMKSTLAPGGPIYEVVEKFRLEEK